MTKKEFVHTLMEKYRIPKEDALKIVEIVFLHVYDNLVKGREVRIDNVGRFGFKFKPARVANDNLAGCKREVGPTVKLKFHAFPSMKRALRASLVEDRDD